MQPITSESDVDAGAPAGQVPDEVGVVWAASEGQVTNASVFLVCVLTFWLIVPIFYALYRAWWTSTHHYVLTDQRLREATGVLMRRIEELELFRVKDISVQCTLLQSLFGRGNVTLLTSDRSTPTVVLRAVANPTGVADMLRRYVQQCRAANRVRELDSPAWTR